MAGEGGGTSKKRNRAITDTAPADANQREDDIDLNLSSDIKGIITALQQFRDKAQKDGQKKTEQIIKSVSSKVKSILDEAKLKFEKERQIFIKAATKACKECESALKSELAKFQAAYEEFCKEKASHLQAYKEIISKFEDEREKLLIRYEQQRKKEKGALAELQKACGDKIMVAEDCLRRKKQEFFHLSPHLHSVENDDKSFSILRKSLGSFLESGSDEDDLDE